ncbi:MAG TPA: hypothetical protein PKA88_26985 [Polyangiaceae bacterium]|nr:hypothetical protein [Polyangiaceae bacterium]
MAELPDDVHAEIVRLSAEGDEAASGERFDQALERFQAAYNLLPEPKQEWEAGLWLLAGIADAHFLAGRFADSADALRQALNCPAGIGNPFVHLRSGQVAYELGDRERAADELARAFLMEGRELFEEDDPKYLAFVLTKLRPPDGFSSWDEYFEKSEEV